MSEQFAGLGWPGVVDAVRQFRAAGMDPIRILALLLKYGPDIVQFIQELIAAWNSEPQPPAQAHRPAACDEATRAGIARAFQMQLKALCATHCAAHSAGCCDDDLCPDDDPG